MIWLGATLVAFWATIYTGNLPSNILPKFWPLALSSGIGIFISALCVLSLYGAYTEIHRAKVRYEKVYEQLSEHRGLPKVTGDPLTHVSGHIFPVFVPVIFGRPYKYIFAIDNV